MTAKPASYPEVRNKIEIRRLYAQGRVDHFEGAVSATFDRSEKDRLDNLAEHWLGRLEGLTEALEIVNEMEMTA